MCSSVITSKCRDIPEESDISFVNCIKAVERLCGMRMMTMSDISILHSAQFRRLEGIKSVGDRYEKCCRTFNLKQGMKMLRAGES